MADFGGVWIAEATSLSPPRWPNAHPGTSQRIVVPGSLENCDAHVGLQSMCRGVSHPYDDSSCFLDFRIVSNKSSYGELAKPPNRQEPCRIDEAGWPDYHAACHAGSIVPPFCAFWVAPLLLFFRRRRTDLSGRMEQGAGPDFWPHGVCGGHRARCFHGRAGRRERVARPVERAQGTAHRAVRLD